MKPYSREAENRGEDLGLRQVEIDFYDALATSERTQAKIRVMVKRILNRFGYPPYHQATETSPPVYLRYKSPPALGEA